MIDSRNILIDSTGHILNTYLQQQKWYQENSNFITSAAGLLATVLAWAVAQPFAESASAQVLIFVAGFILTTVGVKFTPNGFSKSQVRKIEQARAGLIDETPLIAKDSEPSDLDAEVQEYISREM